MQEGWVGLLEKPFDASRETPFHLYVVIVGSWGMLRAVRKEVRASPPDTDAELTPENGYQRPRKKRKPLMDRHATDEMDEDEIEQLAAELDMQAVLDVLDGRERQAIELSFWNGLKQKDAAKVMDLSQPQFNKLLGRAMGKLRAALSPAGQKRADLIPTLKGPKA